MYLCGAKKHFGDNGTESIREISRQKMEKKKIIRINGSSGYQFFRLDKDVFPENYDPDISIESKAISEAKRAEKLNAMYTFFDKAIQLNQTVKVRWEAMLKNLEK